MPLAIEAEPRLLRSVARRGRLLNDGIYSDNPKQRPRGATITHAEGSNSDPLRWSIQKMETPPGLADQSGIKKLHW
jgi:hypothetical protein